MDQHFYHYFNLIDYLYSEHDLNHIFNDVNHFFLVFVDYIVNDHYYFITFVMFFVVFLNLLFDDLINFVYHQVYCSFDIYEHIEQILNYIFYSHIIWFLHNVALNLDTLNVFHYTFTLVKYLEYDYIIFTFRFCTNHTSLSKYFLNKQCLNLPCKHFLSHKQLFLLNFRIVLCFLMPLKSQR